MQNRYGFTRSQAIGRLSHELLKTIFPLEIDDVPNFLLANPQWSGELTQHHANGGALRVMSDWSLTGAGNADTMTITEHHVTSATVDPAGNLLRLANDISQPLTAIGNYVSAVERLLRQDNPDGQAVRRALVLANKEVARCSRKLRLLRELAVSLRAL